MQLLEALDTRITCRAFLDTPVPGETVRAIVSRASRAPSGGNLQPWRVWAVGGDELERLKAIVRSKLAQGLIADGFPEFPIYPSDLKEPYATRRLMNGAAVYGAIEVERDDHEARMRQISRNYEFFGAPVGLFLTIDRTMGVGQWADLGMFTQCLMLLAREYGLHTAPLESWAMWPKTVAQFLDIPDELMLFCGVALGHMDESQSINKVRVGRAPLEEYAVFRGI